MNAAQRKLIAELAEQLNAIMDQIEEIKSEEEDKYDNLPESLRDGEKGDALQEGIDNLEEACNYVQDAIDYLEEVA